MQTMDQTSLMNLAARLKAARQQRGLTQADVAAMLGCTRGAVSQFETGTNQPSLETLIAFARHANVSLDWLVLGKPPAGHYDERIAQLPDALRMYVIEALLLAERVRMSIPSELLLPPTSQNYVSFSDYLTRLSQSLPKNAKA